MSRGLGKIERKILEVLEYKKEQSDIEGAEKKVYVTKLVPEVYFDIYYWDRLDEDSGLYESNFRGEKITDAMFQSVWRAVRSLEKKGHIETYQKIGWGGGEATHHKL